MKLLRRLKLRTKLALVLGLAALAVIASIGAGASLMNRRMLDDRIAKMNEIAGSIAAAVEQQGAATAEIARNVAHTAAAASEMSGRTNEVSAEAAQTGQRAEAVLSDIRALDDAVGEMKQTVVRAVRTSTEEVDRRTTPRFALDLPCRLTEGGRSHDARLTDLSEGGAHVTGGPELAVGARGTLSLHEVRSALPFRVEGSQGGSLRLAFALDAAAAAAFRGIPELLGRRRAACGPPRQPVLPGLPPG